MDLNGEVRGHLSKKGTFDQSRERWETVPSKAWVDGSRGGTGRGKVSEVRRGTKKPGWQTQTDSQTQEEEFREVRWGLCRVTDGTVRIWDFLKVRWG